MRIVLADDHQLVRQALVACLSSYPSIEVVGQASDGNAAVAAALELKPDVLVVDINLPQLSGIEVTRQVQAALGQGCRVLALSMHGNREYIAEMFRAGATGYVVKSAAYDELVQALQTVAEGRTFVSPSIAGLLVDGLRPGTDGGLPNLTARERDVLRLVAAGNNAKEIGDQLGISDKTVHALRARLLKKVGVQSVAELTKYAIRHGYAGLD